MSTQTHKFYLAPLRGITDNVFRAAYEKHFGQFDYIMAPFVPTVLGKYVRDHHIKDLLPNTNGNGTARLIPQIIGNDPTGFLLLCRKFADLGFLSVNWNLGCPAPLIAKKKRGCGLLPHRDIIKRFLDDVAPKLQLPLSIKTRLGLEGKDDLAALIPIFNNYPLKELIIHPRTGAQAYGGGVDIDTFEECIGVSDHTIVYNGDIVSVDTFKRLSERFPNINRWMIGRGIVKNPNLLTDLRYHVNGADASGFDASASANGLDASIPNDTNAISTPIKNLPAVKAFLNDLLDALADHPSPIKVLGRMKEIWGYLGTGIDSSGGLTERIMRC
ncbi:MAG: tRNA-dihydrouridine synthase family protein, partial [Chitinispirillales bacterium]|nr:tRNA-dihydrouridine synthase family protein [Chitinispirillales bacterium]